MCECFSSFSSWPTLALSLFVMNISDGCVTVSHVALICISLKASGVGPHFIRVLVCIFLCVFFVNRSFAHFLLGYLPYCGTVKSSLYIFVSSPLSGIFTFPIASIFVMVWCFLRSFKLSGSSVY